MATREHEESDELPDIPLVRALHGPTSPAELHGAAGILEAYRHAHSYRAPRARWSLRMSASGTTLAVAIALSGGVAAAYTAHLPEPLQRAAHGLHRILGPIAPPPPKEHPARQTVVSAPLQPRRPSFDPKASTPGPRDRHTATETRPHLGGRRRPLAAPSQTLAFAAPRTPVVVHSAVAITGTLLIGSRPVPSTTVELQIRTQRDRPFRTVKRAITDSHGYVHLRSPRLNNTTEVRLIAEHGHVRSSTFDIVTIPTITISPPTTTNRGSYSFRITIDGAQPGDTLYLLSAGDHATLQQTVLSHTETTTVTPPKSSATRHYLIRLPGTAAHGPATATMHT